jgi:hypothetical protein
MHKYRICKKIANWFGEFFGIHIIMLIYTDIFVKKIREVQVKKDYIFPTLLYTSLRAINPISGPFEL